MQARQSEGFEVVVLDLISTSESLCIDTDLNNLLLHVLDFSARARKTDLRWGLNVMSLPLDL